MSTADAAASRAVLHSIISALASHRPVDEREKLSVQQFIDIAPILYDPFNEHADVVHVTASAIVVSGTCGADRVVLHKHKRLGMWLQPGGHIDAGEAPYEAALREAHEETGLVVQHFFDTRTCIHVDVHPGPRGHTHLDLRYLLVASDETPAPAEGESQEVRWFDFKDALEIADEALVGALRAVRQIL